jgi:tRNA(Ile)-lysidine synthase
VKVAEPLLDKMRRFLAALPPLQGVVVAVSGGPDSLALLRALLALQVTPLTVAHVNHQLRGADSDADEQFVRGLCASLGVELRSTRIDMAIVAQEARDNLETTARRFRYDWLAQVARQARTRWIATGHTADDQAETVLHRLLRGTGLRGLRGIAPRRCLAADLEVIRPLLAVSRSEVLAYLEAEQQPFCRDRSNNDLRLTRNRIRHELLPHLAEQYNPAVARLLVQLAAQAEELFSESEERTRRLVTEVERPRAGPLLILDRPRLAQKSRQRIRELFRFLWEREGWPVGRMTFDSWDRLVDVVLQGTTAVDLPDGIRVRCRERVVQVGPGE